ncbi:Hypothetical protein A7982_07844 [Minicystis rosea]|nr:Hypothetical protein A7982_07844 [Minicystis rosea]
MEPAPSRVIASRLDADIDSHAVRVITCDRVSTSTLDMDSHAARSTLFERILVVGDD